MLCFWSRYHPTACKVPQHHLCRLEFGASFHRCSHDAVVDEDASLWEALYMVRVATTILRVRFKDGVRCASVGCNSWLGRAVLDRTAPLYCLKHWGFKAVHACRWSALMAEGSVPVAREWQRSLGLQVCLHSPWYSVLRWFTRFVKQPLFPCRVLTYVCCCDQLFLLQIAGSGNPAVI